MVLFRRMQLKENLKKIHLNQILLLCQFDVTCTLNGILYSLFYFIVMMIK